MTSKATFDDLEAIKLKLRGLRIQWKEHCITHWCIEGCIDFWPTKEKWAFRDGSANGVGLTQLICELGKREWARHIFQNDR